MIFALTTVEGTGDGGREVFIPALLETLGLHYTSSSPPTMIITHNKAKVKQLLKALSIPTPDFIVIDRSQELNTYIKKTRALKAPMIVKPHHEESSIGIFNRSFVFNIESLKKQTLEILYSYNQPAVVEHFLPGREFTVAIIGNENSIRVLPFVENNV